jgi:hypothetical protein
MAAVILTKRLMPDGRHQPPAGARPCFGLFTLSAFKAEAADLDTMCGACGAERHSLATGGSSSTDWCQDSLTLRRVNSLNTDHLLASKGLLNICSV